MDLTVQIDNTSLNIRVAIIMETDNGYVLQKHKGGYYFFLGGRIKINETSLQAARREVEEETGLEIENFQLVSIVENFFETPEGKVHELCFVYTCAKQEKINPDFGLVEYAKTDLENMDIRPEIIKQIILKQYFSQISHFVV